MIRIAIVFDLNKSGGGANQYQVRFLERLIQTKSDTNLYEFLLINPPPEFTCIAKEFKIIKLKRFYILEILHRKLFFQLKLANYLKLNQLFLSNLEKKLFRLKADYTYFLTPDIRSLSFIKMPIFLTVWDVGHRKLQNLEEYQRNQNFNYLENFYKSVLKNCSLIFVESQTTAADIQNYYDVLPSKIVNLGLSWAVPYKKCEPSLGVNLPYYYTYLYYPANYWSHKNHFFLMRVLKEIVKNSTEVRLILTGKDQMFFKTKVENYIKELGLNDYIIDLGYVSEEMQQQIYTRVNCLVFPSLLGPTNIPPYEAAFYGVPSVLSNVHESENYDIEGIYIMKNFDVIEWSSKIQFLIENQVRANYPLNQSKSHPIEALLKALNSNLSRN